MAIFADGHRRPIAGRAICETGQAQLNVVEIKFAESTRAGQRQVRLWRSVGKALPTSNRPRQRRRSPDKLAENTFQTPLADLKRRPHTSPVKLCQFLKRHALSSVTTKLRFPTPHDKKSRSPAHVLLVSAPRLPVHPIGTSSSRAIAPRVSMVPRLNSGATGDF